MKRKDETRESTMQCKNCQKENCDCTKKTCNNCDINCTNCKCKDCTCCLLNTEPRWDEKNLMKAMVWDGKNNMIYTDKPRPMLTDDKDVILRITATTICGSDLHLYQGTMSGMERGDIVGHEFMGIVEDVGRDVKTLQVGDRVVCSFAIACGECNYCLREEYSACDRTNPNFETEKLYGHRTGAFFGYSHLTGGVPGGQAEFVRVPIADVNCLLVPNELSDEKALLLSDVIPTAYHGTQLGDVTEKDTVAIWGLGPVGLMCARWCQIIGAKRIIGIDRVPERIALARSLGIETINFKEKSVKDTLHEMVPGGPDVAIECVGFDYAKSLVHKIETTLNLETDSSDVLKEMFTCVRKFGRVAIIGVYSGFTNHFPIGAMMEKNLIVKSGQCPVQKYWKMALEKVMSGELDPTFIYSYRGKLSEGPELYQKFNDKEDGIIKVFLRPDTHSKILETKV